MSYRQGDIQPNSFEYETIEVGYEARLKHRIEQEDVKTFAELTGDFNPVHMDPAFAKQTTFGKPVVHGMLTSSFISTMIGMLIPGPGALWTSQTLEFLSPTYVGDEITVTARVNRKSPATRMLLLEVTITNQHGHKLVVGDSKVRMMEHEDQTESQPRLEESQVSGVGNENQSVEHSKGDQKIILVTGGSRGIGAATVQNLAADGHTVVLNYLQVEDAAQTVIRQVCEKGGKAIAVQGNVADEGDVEYLFSSIESRVGAVQSIVHCAAPNPIPQAFVDLEWDVFQKHLDTQLKGAFNCVKRALPHMIQAESGAIVFLGSIFADGIPPVQQSAYVVTKSALAALARSLAVEYGPKGVRVNVVSPGMTHTEMISNIPQKVKMLAKMNTPLRRLAQPEEIATTIRFLLSPESKHITGETIRVCGGLVMS
jgi:3-oxoacyl-[acyl-carrier protein] reductase